MGTDDLAVKAVRDGAVCTLILAGDPDILTAGEFLQHAARVLDDRIERFVLDLARTRRSPPISIRLLCTEC